MTTAEKLCNQFKDFLMEQVKENLKKKYPDITEEDLNNMIAEYETVNPPPL